jgi:hypothetical protein
MMLAKFRSFYPQGSLVSEFIDIERGLYLVKVTIEVGGIILATGLASGETIELAEDRARERAIAAVITEQPIQTQITPNGHSETITPATEVTKSNLPSLPVELEPEAKPTRSTLFPTISAIPEPEAKPTRSHLFPTISAIPETELEPEPEAKPNRSNSFPTISATPEPELEELNISTSKTTTMYVEPDIEETQPSLFPTMSNEPATAIANEVEEEPTQEINFHEITHQIDIHIKRLGWTQQDGRSFLQTHYGKRSRLHLNNEQLLEFLRYLESLPDPS